MNSLDKTKICPCGTEKKVKWVDPMPFVMGYVDCCVGHSTCESCGLTQTHYSGSPDGAFQFHQFMQEMENNSANSK
jgi:hypothetical protein